MFLHSRSTGKLHEQTYVKLLKEYLARSQDSIKLGIVVAAAANFITREYSVNQWLCYKNETYFNQDKMLLKA